MTLPEFQTLFTNIHKAITDLVKANVDVSKVKVIGRDCFDEDEAEWVGRIMGNDGTIRCWSVFPTSTAGLDDENTPTATETFIPMFGLIGYHYYDFGTDSSNSNKSFQDELNKLRWAFMNNQALGLPDYVESHSGFINRTTLGKIDTTTVHIARVDLGVQLHPIAYTYDGS